MTTHDITIHRGYLPGAIGRITELHGTYYAPRWGLGLFFEAKVGSGLAEFMGRYDEAHDGLWLALDGEVIIGGIVIDGLKAATEGARLRWFIIDPAYQGRGVGRRLMGVAVDFCRASHFKRVYLTTFAGLDSARHLYEQVGFRLIEQEVGDQWGTVLTEQKFEWLLSE
ncbi:MAG: GNAT family N-acetyltransferase [Chloroflexi bacterium]|nr:GNAT family N-acetyltransferase [Chloroflexota bacterium]